MVKRQYNGDAFDCVWIFNFWIFCFLGVNFEGGDDGEDDDELKTNEYKQSNLVIFFCKRKTFFFI